MKRIRKAILALILVFSFAIPLPASAAMNGIDVSSWQTGIEVDDMSMDFVIVKATEGTSYINPDCDRVYQDAVDAGYKTGVYHFASGGDALAEAKHFVDNISGYIGDAILVLDYEGSAVYQGVGWAKDWLDAVYNMTGVKPLIYMSNSVIHQYDWTSVVDTGYDLWNAGYYAGYAQIYGFVSDPPLYGGLGEFADNTPLYQYTSSGRLLGWSGNLDLNIFYGNAAEWDAYAGHKSSGNYTPSEKPQHAEDKIIYYTVQGGDTLSEIAAMYNTTYQAIAEKNGLSNPNLIYPGQRLVISGKYASSSGTSWTSTYTVRYGDCLSTIGSRLGVSWQSIANANGIKSPYIIYTGQVLKIPGGSSGGGKYYIIRSGDTLSGIAAAYGTLYQYLAQINGIGNPDLIYPGQSIRMQ